MPLTVRNSEKNTTVFTKTVGGDMVRITWGAAGSFNDTQRVPDSLADDVDFLNALDQGVLTVEDGPSEIVERLHRETRASAERREQQLAAQAAQTEAVMNRSQDRDLMGASCIGPAPAGRQGLCGRSLVISRKNVEDVPPLCAEHAHLAPTFILTEDGSKGEGATQSREGVVRREWKQATLMPAAKSL